MIFVKLKRVKSFRKIWYIETICVLLHCENQVGGWTLNFTDFVNIRKIGFYEPTLSI